MRLSELFDEFIEENAANESKEIRDVLKIGFVSGAVATWSRQHELSSPNDFEVYARDEIKKELNEMAESLKEYIEVELNS